MDKKGYFTFLISSLIDVCSKKNKQLLEYYNFKKDLKNGKEKYN
tara:strand:+ start:192 stop:323 length:132 start_codon:yes stop_codon:yes gene_type:complete